LPGRGLGLKGCAEAAPDFGDPAGQENVIRASISKISAGRWLASPMMISLAPPFNSLTMCPTARRSVCRPFIFITTREMFLELSSSRASSEESVR
jgi:hypothetical protein